MMGRLSGLFYVSKDGHPDLTAVLLELVRRDVAVRGQRRVARDMGLDHSAVSRWLDGTRGMTGDSVDAIVLFYGLRAVVVEMQRQRGPVRPVPASESPVHVLLAGRDDPARGAE